VKIYIAPVHRLRIQIVQGVVNVLPSYGCLGGAVVGRRTRDQKVANSTPATGALSSQLGQLSLSSLWGR